MKLEDQVCSLELAKRLKELGVRKDSIFYWLEKPFRINVKENGEQEMIEWETQLAFPPYSYIASDVKVYSAFSVGELGEMLPLGKLAASSKDESGWYMQVIAPIEKWKEMYPCKNEADARAKMLIHLIEQGIVKI